MFQPDVLLPSQLTIFSGKAPAERRLLSAILEDAVHCFRKYAFAHDPHGKRLFDEANEWIMGDGDGAHFSFEFVCDVLGLDAGYLRAGLMEWHQEAAAVALANPKAGGHHPGGNRTHDGGRQDRS